MKLVVAAVALLAISLLLSAQAPESSQSNTGVIEGRVLSSTTSEPIADVVVTLLAAPPAGLSPEELQQRSAQLESMRLNTLVAGRGGAAAEEVKIDKNAADDTYMLSDSDGHFAFRNLAPGRYTVRAAGQGYIGPPRNGGFSSGTEKSVVVRAGSSSVDLVVIRGVVIAGRVFDPLGQPVANAIVREYRLLYNDGHEHWGAGPPNNITDDRGQYRFFTAPDALFLGVTPPSGGVPKSWDQTFYPSATEPEDATLIPVPPGSQTTTLDIHLQPRRASVNVRGVAINPFAVANAKTGVVDRSVSNFYLLPSTPGVFNISAMTNAIPVAARANGEFEIQNVRPGQYELVAYVLDLASRRQLIARTPLDVGGADIVGVSLTIDPGVTLNGQVEFRGTPNSIDPGVAQTGQVEFRGIANPTLGKAMTVVFQGLSGLPFTSNQRIENGMFAMEHVPRVPYRVNVSGLPAGAYVADVRLDGTSIFDNGFVPGEVPGPLQIVVEAAGETVTGTVKGPKGEPFEAGNVVLVPPEEQRQNPQRFQSGVIDGQGHFTIRSVPPGSYTAYAWASVQSSAWMNAKFMSQYQGTGHPVTVGAGSKNELELEGIPYGR